MRARRLLLVLIALGAGSTTRAEAQAVPATIPLEVLPIETALAEGQIAIGGRVHLFGGGPVVAAQPARVARGIIIGKSGGRRRLLALAILGGGPDWNGKSPIDVSPMRQAWCELPSAAYMSAWTDYTVDCFQDADGDGALDKKYAGHIEGDVAVMLSNLAPPDPIKPIPYEPADPADLPRFDIGYWSCGATAETAAGQVRDFRYSTLVRAAGTKGLGARVCKDAAKLLEARADGSRVLRFGRFTVEVWQEGEQLRTRLVDGIPAGTILGNLRIDRPLLEFGEEVPHVRDELAGYTKPALYLTSIPATQSLAGRGERFFTAGIAHGVTGRLRSDVAAGGWRRKIAFTAGTPVFGVPMGVQSGHTRLDSSIVWCTPEREVAAPGQAPPLTAVCFMPGANGFGLSRNEQPFHVESLHGTYQRVEAPIVDPAEVDFGEPLELWIRFVTASDEELVLETSVSFAREPRWKRMVLKLTEEGMVTLLVGAAMLDLRASADHQHLTVSVWGEFKIGADALVKRVRRVKRS